MIVPMPHADFHLPMGFQGGDANLYRYVENSPLNWIDPFGLERLPADWRGTWIDGTRGDGIFEYSDIPVNQKDGLVGKRVQFKNNCIGIGGFPAEFYYQGSASAASVEITTIRGTDADFTAADKEMRVKLNDPNWRRPKGYSWNHAGDSSSRTMELVQRTPHQAVAHEGSASLSRALTRSAKSTVVRAVAVGAVYMTLRDAAKEAGIAQPDYEPDHEDYFFVAEDGSVFNVFPAGWWSSAQRKFVAGPREGQSEDITTAEVESHRKDAEAKWGKYVPGTLFREPRFIPGTERKSLPLSDGYNQTGYIDENGVHRFKFVPPRIY